MPYEHFMSIPPSGRAVARSNKRVHQAPPRACGAKLAAQLTLEC